MRKTNNFQYRKTKIIKQKAIKETMKNKTRAVIYALMSIFLFIMGLWSEDGYYFVGCVLMLFINYFFIKDNWELEKNNKRI